METTLLYNLSEICAAPKGMIGFELFTSQKGIDFDHINVKQGEFFTLAWHWLSCFQGTDYFRFNIDNF